MNLASMVRLKAGSSSAFKSRIRAIQLSQFRWIFDIPVALLFGRNLKALATLYGSDKWNTHWYAQHYEAHFRPIRRRKLTVIEIGIGGYEDPAMGGGSLRMWRTWFPNARIHGIDIADKSLHRERRISIHRGSQTDTAFLRSVVSAAGRPDVIIDDGSHRSADIIQTFKELFPLLSDEGFYSIEDTQTAYWPSSGPPGPTSMEFFKSLIDGLNWEEFFGEYEPTAYDLQIKAIHFYHNLIVIQKGNNCEGSNNRAWNSGTDAWKQASAGGARPHEGRLPNGAQPMPDQPHSSH